ncbi:acyl-CoA dehydrogenase [Melghirimyces profundicolus]|uniref:Acyl-CoA dehydrogenase n=1 Tax=Melghirimyces profundicolus TaxID=1242148 RepID=A0A2T6BFZ7_9BACL|nr:acyl-CoA dehydrogenase family protein [Melghirimyces profundicolus]PTX54988.1 acyl-CoA dehydrogenase [Melghirimyces profundicolus]
MISFSMTEEQKELSRLARKFAREEMRPVASECDEKEIFPRTVFEKAHQTGLITYRFPEKYHGGGVDSLLTSCIISEELFWGCAGFSTSFGVSALAAGLIHHFGDEEQKKKWLTFLCDPGKVRMGAVCLTEPGAGSDFGAIRTRAERDGDGWKLDGTKCFITNGGIADLYLVFAKTRPEEGAQGVSLFLVPADTPGVSAGKKEKKMGQRASHTADVIFEGVRVAGDALLGEENMGFYHAMKMLEESRPVVGAGAVGVARAAYEYALDYARERKQFGKPIFKNQSISFMLADMRSKIEASRLLVWRAAEMYDRGEPCSMEGSMAKAFAAETAMEVTTNAVQILGGYGYMRDYPVEKWMRDAKVLSIYEGTTQIQKLVMTKLMEAE